MLKAPEQHLTCTISEPAEGAVFDLGATITIKGDATADIGSVSAAVLKVGGKTIAEVTNVPFTYEYAVAADPSRRGVENRAGGRRRQGGAPRRR